MLNEIIKKLETLDKLSTTDGISNHFLDISNNELETVVSANREGFIWLALEALKLAQNAQNGTHIHIDEDGIADKSDKSLVLSYKNEEWS